MIKSVKSFAFMAAKNLVGLQHRALAAVLGCPGPLHHQPWPLLPRSHSMPS